MFEVDKTFVFIPGDPAAGLHDQSWEIDGSFVADSEEELERIRSELKLSFGEIADGDARVIFEHEFPNEPEPET